MVVPSTALATASTGWCRAISGPSRGMGSAELCVDSVLVWSQHGAS